MRRRLKPLFVISIALLCCHIAAPAASNRLELKFSSPKRLGDVVQSPLTQAVKIYRNNSGKYEAHFATNGTPATFNVVDVESGEPTFSERLSTIESVWGIIQGSDGNIYFGGNQGILARYSPKEKKIEELGKNPSGPAIWDLEATEDGRILGATYPAAKVFEYEINAGRFYDRGTIQPREKYVRGLGISDGFLYAGVGSSIYLYKIDLKTFKKTEVLLPNTGTTGFIHNIEAFGNSVFVKADSWFVLDKEANKVVASFTSDNSTLSPPAPHNPDLIYFTQGANLCTYNLRARTVSKIDGIPALPEGLIQDLEWVTLTHGNHKGKTVLAGVTSYAERFFYDPKDQWFDLIPLKAVSDGLRIKSVEADSERLYVGGYPKGMAIISLATDKVENIATRINQPEGTGFLNGKAYFGTYGGAVMYRYTPSRPFDFGEDANHNPGLIYNIGDAQDRPFAFASGDNKLFIGTVPGYGELGGALTIYDEALHTWKVHRNVVPAQSVVGLAYRNGKVYGGTSIWGGLGGDPLSKEAKIFVWDVEKGEKIAEFTPEIPQIDAPPQIIGGLSFGPDGLLWGAIKGTVFALNPETYKVVKSRVIYPSNYRAHVWIPTYLRWGDDGLLYTTLGSHITIIDPKTLAYQTVVKNVNFMALGKDGAIYYASKADLYKISAIGK